MYLSYLKPKTHLIFIIHLIIFFYADLYVALTFMGLNYFVLLFVFRKKLIFFKDNETTTKGVVYSPVNGVIEKIDRSFVHDGIAVQEIFINIPFGKEMGISVPFSSELTELKKDQMNFINFQGLNVRLHFIKRRLSGWPLVRLLPGDRAKRQVNIGHLPLGGILLLYLPTDYKIMTNVGESISAGISPIAILEGTK